MPSSTALVSELKAAAADTGMAQADVIRQALKLGIPALRSRLGKAPRRRHLSMVDHFARLKGLELPPYLH